MLTLNKGRSAQKAQERQNGTAEIKATKTSNENNNTVSVQKNDTRQKKTQGEKKTTAKNYFERKINIAQTA